MNQLTLLVGDNPFHGISHLSQQRARGRFSSQQDFAEYASSLVALSLKNGADGFMFSVDETTLAIIRNLPKNGIEKTRLYALAPYSYEYVRKATLTGGVSGLAKSVGKDMVFSSSNMKVIAQNLGGLVRFKLPALLKTYVTYEISRLKSATNGKMPLESFMLQELVTDMALALNLEGLFKDYIRFLEKRGIRAGFETRNFPYLVNKFSEWDIDFGKLTLTASFNKVGFQMCPTKAECEEALRRARKAEVYAMSVLAAGYLKPNEASGYLTELEGLSGAVIGVSKEKQATETFRALRGN